MSNKLTNFGNVCGISGGLLLVVFCCVFSVNAYSVEGEKAETKLDSFLKDLETYSAAFEQKLFNEAGEELEKSVGVLYIRRPGMFHWSYWEPYTQTIISNGVTLWIHDEDLEQVIIRNIGDSIENSPAAILGGDVVISDHYLVIDTGVRGDVSWLELTPRDIESQYKLINLGFKKGQIKQMVLFDNLGQKSLITFLDAKRNTALNIELFEFTPPEGIDIIDNRD